MTNKPRCCHFNTNVLCDGDADCFECGWADGNEDLKAERIERAKEKFIAYWLERSRKK